MAKYTKQVRIGFSIDEDNPVVKKLQELSERYNLSFHTICKLVCMDVLSGTPSMFSQEHAPKNIAPQQPIGIQDAAIQQLLENASNLDLDDVYLDDTPEK